MWFLLHTCANWIGIRYLMFKIKKNGKTNFGILNKEMVERPVPDKVDEEDVIGGSDNNNIGDAVTPDTANDTAEQQQ